MYVCKYEYSQFFLFLSKHFVIGISLKQLKFNEVQLFFRQTFGFLLIYINN